MTTDKNDIERSEDEVAEDESRDALRTEVRAIVAELESVGSHAEKGSQFRTTEDASAFNDQMHYLANRLRAAFGDPIPESTPAEERDAAEFEHRKALEDADEFMRETDDDEALDDDDFLLGVEDEGAEDEDALVQPDPIELHGQPGAKHWVQPMGNDAESDPEAVFEDGDGTQKNDKPNEAG